MKATNRDILRLYLRHMRPYKWWLLAVFVLAVVPEFLWLVQPWLLKAFFDTIAEAKPSPEAAKTLVGILWAIIGLRFAVWVCYRSAAPINNRFRPQVQVDLDKSSFAYLIGHSYRFFANSFAGSLVRRVRRLSRSYISLTDNLLWRFIPIAVSLVGSIALLAIRDWRIALVMGIWTLVMVVMNYFVSMWKLRFDEERSRKDSEVTGALADAITNSESIRLFASEKAEAKRFAGVADQFRRLQTLTWNLGEINIAAQWILLLIAEFALMYVAIGLWSEGTLTIGDFSLIQAYMWGLFGNLRGLGHVIRDTFEAFAEAKEMVEVLNEPHEIKDRRGAKPLEVTRGNIQFKELGFAYNKTRTVLHDLDLEIEPGEKIALVGPSGAGKSTVVKLLLRLFDASEGKVLIDGQDIARVTQASLRAQVALVPQDPALFHRSIMENIRYGRPEATDKEVVEAAKRARCHGFIQELQDGYDTLVGERGVKLSGGERQRVAIARAILKNAPVLVLDEATSSLDSESESLIQEALEELMKGKTAIVIAHRLSTILSMDRIIVMENGRIIDEGTHDELSNREGLYKKLWEIQAGGFIA